MWSIFEMSESETQVWVNLETALGERFSAAERFVWFDDVVSYRKEQIAFDVLVDKIRNTRAFYGATSRRRHPLGEMLPNLATIKEKRGAAPTRPELLTAVIAMHAEQDTMVRHFRQDVLQGQLLPWSEIQ